MRNAMAIVMAVLILVFTMTACETEAKSDEELIRDRIVSFMNAYNKGDLDTLKASLDSQTRKTFEATIDLAQMIGGAFGMNDSINISDLFTGLFQVSVGLMTEGEPLNFEILQISVSDSKHATVTAEMRYQDKLDSFSEKVVFTMLKEKGNWYIKNLESK